MEETKVIYHIDEEDTPYLVKIYKPPNEVTLADFKAGIATHFQRYKFFFKSQDDDFGVVKEEIIDDQAILPLFNGRVVSWLVASEGSVAGLSQVHAEDDDLAPSELLLPPPGLQREAGVGETRPPSFHGGDLRNAETESVTESESAHYYEDTGSTITSVSQIRSRRRQVPNRGPLPPHQLSNGHPSRRNRPPPLPGPGIPPPSDITSIGGRGTVTATETSSMMSSEIESSICDDTEDLRSEASSRFTTSTDHTSVSRNLNMRQRQKKKSRRKVPQHLARAGSSSSVTDSTMSLNIITVILNMDTGNFLGISIVGQSNKYGDGDCGIYVGSIMKGGAVACDGRIEPGDMILQVNDISFENMSNDEAVRVLKEVVQKPGPIKLVVAKCWDTGTSNRYFTLPRTEPVRPIDPGAWVAHTAAVRELLIPEPPPSIFAAHPLVPGHSCEPLLADYPGRAASVATMSASSVVSSHPETEKYLGLSGPPPLADFNPDGAVASNTDLMLTINSGMVAIIRAMQKPGSGLEISDRTWLKIKIHAAVMGSEMVDWLFANVEGFDDRRDAKKYACQMVKAGYIEHTVKKNKFSEQCYYTFCDEKILSDNVHQLEINVDVDSNNSPIHPLGRGAAAHPKTIGLPLMSGGSGGSNPMQGNWCNSVPPTRVDPTTHLWEAPWAGPQSGSGSASTATYGPIYNPTAPPPSANYTAIASNYSGYGSGHDSTFGGQVLPRGIHHSSGSSHQSDHRLQLAASSSGSESASDGRAQSVLGRPQVMQQRLSNQQVLGVMASHNHQQPVFQA